MTDDALIERATERARMQRSLAAITRRRIFAGARSIAGRRWQREPNWVVAMEVFCVGSAYAHALCDEMDIDPDGRTVPPLHVASSATPTTPHAGAKGERP